MLTRLPEEIVCAIATQLSPATLAVLSCVSKRFHAICLPLLYKRVVIDGPTIAKWRWMVSSGHLAPTQAYHIEFLSDVCDASNSKELLQTLATSLRQMPGLRSFKLCGFWVGLLDQAIDGQNSSVLHELQSLQHLETIFLYHAQNPRCNFAWRLPKFKNLQSLALHRLGEREWRDKTTDVVEVLLASPGLRHLGLSFVPEAGLDNDFLCMVIFDFRSRRQQLEQPALQLESLHLGIGTMPWSNPRFDMAGYLDDLTDLSYLTSLRLDNMQYLPFEGPVVPYEPIDPSLFEHAINLRRISVERFGSDILRLVQLMQEVQSPLRLDALDVLEYGNTLQPDSPEFANEPIHEFHAPESAGEPIYSVPLDKTGDAWRRICYSGPVALDGSEKSLKKSQDLLTHFVARCTALEELIIPIHNRDEFDILKTDVLPCLPNLHTLHLPWPHLAAFLSDLQTPWNEPYIIHHMSEEEKERVFQKDRELDREQEKTRISFVHELFSYHLQLREDRADMSPLRYIAIDRDVYARHWTDTPAEGHYRLNDGSSIIRLSRDEARSVGIVENLCSEWVLRLPV